MPMVGTFSAELGLINVGVCGRLIYGVWELLGGNERNDGLEIDCWHDFQHRLTVPIPKHHSRLPANNISQVNDDERSNFGRRRSTVLELRQALAASKRATNEAAEADEAVPAEARFEAAFPEEERHQEPTPAPFRGTFWDEDDGEPTFPARRVSYNLHSGKR